MKIGVPKEIKAQENRVAMTPAGVSELVKKHRHEVFVQKSAGEGSGFSCEDYKNAGATILETIEEVYSASQMIVKVKEPIEPEYGLIKKDHILFTYLHLASSKALTEALLKSEATCIAYETVTHKNGSLPLLTPMSEVAGRMSVQQGAKFLEKPSLGKGILLGGVPGVRPANVIVLGGGIVGTQAAYIAAGMGANVTLMDINLDRLRFLSSVMPKNVVTMFSSQYALKELLPTADLVIGATLVVGEKASHLITKDMLSLMQKGSVLVDVSVDQGGCFETTKPTTHKDPIFIVDDIVHYCVANIPGAVPMTSTKALTNATLPYVVRLANEGWEKALKNDPHFYNGLNIVDGKLVFEGVATSLNMPYTKFSL